MSSLLKSNAQVKTGLYAAVVVFLAYTMIFGFRKSFTVGTFDGLTIAGYSYKTLLVISQMLGYLLAKFYGIKYISELKRTGRGKIILILTGVSWISWLFFALVPMPYNLVFLFINGFPLGSGFFLYRRQKKYRFYWCNISSEFYFCIRVC